MITMRRSEASAANAGMLRRKPESSPTHAKDQFMHRSTLLSAGPLGLTLTLAFPLTALGQAESTGGGSMVSAPASVTSFRPDADSSRPMFDSEGRFIGNIAEIFAAMPPEAVEWLGHVFTLAGPYFEGRAGGLAGFERATDYMGFHFRQLGLEPAFPEADSDDDQTWTSYRQPFSYPARMMDRPLELEAAMLQIGPRMLEHGTDFTVLASSGGHVVTAPLSFAGYGIATGPDDYSSFAEDDDLTGRTVLLLRYEPLNDEGRSRWSDNRFSARAGLVGKYRALIERGAAAILLVNPPGAVDGERSLQSMAGSARGAMPLGIPILHITEAVAEELLLSASGEDLMTWRRRADAGEIGAVHFDGGMQTTIEGRTSLGAGGSEWPSANAGGVLRGRGTLADEWVIIGGHHDHLGYGRSGTRAPNERGSLHPGADDNASGTAGVLVMARMMKEWYDSMPEDQPRRSLLFMGFGAEEAGLYGSAHFIDHPTIPLDKVNMMINFDMIGRLRGNRLMLNGTGTAEEFETLLPPLVERSGLTVAMSPGGRGPSDHANFYRAGIPVLFFFTGLHDEYHTPADTAETVDPVGAVRVLAMAHDVLEQVAVSPQRLSFQRGETRVAQRRAAAPPRPRLGIVIGQADDDQEGVVIGSVSDGGAAAEAGLQAGDRIIRWNDEDVTGATIAPFLGRHAPGDQVRLGIRRGTEELTITVTLGGAS